MNNAPAKNSTSIHTRKLWAGFFTGIILGFTVVAFGHGFRIGDEVAIRQTLLNTAHVSFFLFLVPMIARPLRDLNKNAISSYLVKNRSVFGLAFAGNHLWHLAFIVLLYQVSHEQPEPLAVLIGGSFGFLYLAAMAIFSFPAPIRLIGAKKTKLLHQLAFYYLVGVFFYDIVLRNLETPNPVLWVLFWSAIALRLLSWASTYFRKEPVIDS
ncbi:MAG: hypothetical protein AAF542_06445 [Pseudomonadota bacterium]